MNLSLKVNGDVPYSETICYAETQISLHADIPDQIILDIIKALKSKVHNSVEKAMSEEGIKLDEEGFLKR